MTDEERPLPSRPQPHEPLPAETGAGPLEAARRAAAAVRDAAQAVGGPIGARPRNDAADPPEDEAGAAGDETGDREPAERPAEHRSAQLRLARVHLRTGAYALARTELETLAGHGGLDVAATLDLAEVRWRTGDLAGAGEAASSYISSGGDDAVGYVIAAEAAAAADRPAEARRLVGRALERSAEGLDAVFAGIPRSDIWPHESATVHAWDEAAASSGVAIEPTEREAIDVAPAQAQAEAAPVPATVSGRPSSAAAAPPRRPPAPAGQGGLWDASPADPLAMPGEAETEIAAGAAALADDPAAAAVHFGVALRLAPTSASAVLDALGSTGAPVLELVRGDALRLLGYEWDARRAYLGVAAGLRADRAGRPVAGDERATAGEAATTDDGGSAPPDGNAQRPSKEAT